MTGSINIDRHKRKKNLKVADTGYSVQKNTCTIASDFIRITTKNSIILYVCMLLKWLKYFLIPFIK